MARTARYEEDELASAKRLVGSAKTLQQLRQGQAILLPALTGASMDTTADILGIGRNHVCVLRRQFRQAGGSTFGERDRRGGRRRQLMSIEEEKVFLAPWIEKAKGGGVLVVPPIHAAYEQRVGKPVPRSTIYRLLARHGWRKVTPDTRHPKADVQAQEAFKKSSRRSSPKR
jgi:transposase